MRSSKLLLVALLATLVLAPRCEEPRNCVEPGTDLDTTPPALGVLPAWAIGEFAHHSIDVANWRITAQGEAFYVFEGGDYGGGCSKGTATFADDRVLISFRGFRNILVHTNTGRFFMGYPDPDGGQVGQCGWSEVANTALCGRDMGACGGFGSAVHCTWEEAVGTQCDSEQDGGTDAGAPDGGTDAGGP